MTTFLDVETADFRAAARSMRFDAAEPMGRAASALINALSGTGSMGGNDPAGTQWAAHYDRGARVAAQAGVDVANAGYRLAGMFDQSADNYESADAASAARDPVPALARSPFDEQLFLVADPPSAHGGSGAGPAGWSIVAATVGYVWPDGHQDRLHAAAAAWHAAGLSFETRGDRAALAALAFAGSRLPETDDVIAVCNGLDANATELAAVYHSLGDSCTELARHIDTAHASVIHELEMMAGESAVIQVVGAAAGAVTAGAAEAAAQSAQAARIKHAVDKITALLATFKAATLALAARVAHIADRAVAVAQRLRVYRTSRLLRADLKVAGGWQKTNERFALIRLKIASGATDLGLPASRIERREGHFAIVEGGVRTRKVAFRSTTDPAWGLTRKHLYKHLFGPGKYSLSRIDPAGSSDVWFRYLQELAHRPSTVRLEDGVEEVHGIFPRTDGDGTFRLGIRIKSNDSGGYDLVTILTRQDL